MDPLHMRFFIRTRDGEITPSDLIVEWPKRFTGFPGKPLPPEQGPIFQVVAWFPGVLPADGMSSRRQSNLHAMIEVLNSVEHFCVEFEKAGGTMYFAMPNDESKPFLGEPVKAKRFFKL